ncbi:hypothetical protein HY837_03990 [archaeon]|nr:hypothetical protein [archaeon]
MATLEKVLNLSLKDYLELNEKTIKDYSMHGLHYCIETKIVETMQDAINKFAEKAPENTEAIVNYSQSHTSTGNNYTYIFISMTGIALVPKPKKRHNPEII